MDKKPTDKFRPPATKICTGCKKGKSLKDFYLSAESRDGRHSKCRDCLRAIEDQKKKNSIEKAKTFFNPKYFTLFFLLSTSTAFSQDTVKHRVDLKAQGWIVDKTPDTLRAIILATMCRKCAAEPMPGYVVIEQGKRPIYLNRCKRALKLPQVGWGYEIVGGKEK